VAAASTTTAFATSSGSGASAGSLGVFAAAPSLAAPEGARGVPLSPRQSLTVFTPASDPFRVSIGLLLTEDGSALTGAADFAGPVGLRLGKNGVRRPIAPLS